MNALGRMTCLLGLSVALFGCPKKDEAAAGTDAAPAVASASAAPTASVAAPADTTPSAGTVVAHTDGPPKGAPEVVDDPNAPPSHDDHEKAATATIQKNNYKSELDKLEKEDLGK